MKTDIWFLCKTNLSYFSFCRDYSLVGKSDKRFLKEMYLTELL